MIFSVREKASSGAGRRLSETRGRAKACIENVGSTLRILRAATDMPCGATPCEQLRHTVPRRAARSGGTASHLSRWGGDLQVAVPALTSGHAAPTLPGMDAPVAGSEPVVTLTPYAVEMVRKVRARAGLSDSSALRGAVAGGRR